MIAAIKKSLSMKVSLTLAIVTIPIMVAAAYVVERSPVSGAFAAIAEKEPQAAFLVNALAVRNLALACRQIDARLVHFSTDYVFDGSKDRPWVEDDSTNPLSVYGTSKLAGEEAAKKAWKHVITRTSWLFGTRGWNFVEAIRKQVLSGRRELRVVNDQRGRPTYTPHLGAALIRLSRQAIETPDARGLFHYADEPECTWFDFASEIARRTREDAGISEEVVVLPCSSSEYPRPAARPAYSVLSTERYERVTGVRPGSWHDALDEYFALLPSSQVMAK